jgi:hypothetical protein
MGGVFVCSYLVSLLFVIYPQYGLKPVLELLVVVCRLHFLHAVSTQAVVVVQAYVFALFLTKDYCGALAQRYRTGFAFKLGLAPGAVFTFVFLHNDTIYGLLFYLGFVSQL